MRKYNNPSGRYAAAQKNKRSNSNLHPTSFMLTLLLICSLAAFVSLNFTFCPTTSSSEPYIDHNHLLFSDQSILKKANVNFVDEDNNKKHSKSLQWPAIRKQEVPAKLVYLNGGQKENNGDSSELFYTNKSLYRRRLIEFANVYARRPEKDNLCGIRFNHAYALWLTIVELKPKMIIESGVNSGISTWFMRQAASTFKINEQFDDAVIVSIDPEDKPICKQPVRWLDEINQDRYLGKEKFVDFTKLDWNMKMKQHNVSPDQVLVYIDDHLPFFPRVSTFLKYGFKHVILEDNYKLGQGATHGDKWATPKQLFQGGHKKYPNSQMDGKWLIDNLEAYAEFPPLVPATLAPLSHVRKKQGGFLHATDDPSSYEEPALRPDLNESIDKELYSKVIEILNLDKELKDTLSYTQIMNYCHIVYMEFKVLAPTLRNSLN